MYPSSALCRTQEALQRNRATNTPLPNVRAIAERAAAAWGAEARLAEKREQRHERTRSTTISAADTKQRMRENDIAISENPDRGLAALAY